MESLSRLRIISRALQHFLIYLTSLFKTFNADSTRQSLEMRASTSYLVFLCRGCISSESKLVSMFLTFNVLLDALMRDKLNVNPQTDCLVGYFQAINLNIVRSQLRRCSVFKTYKKTTVRRRENTKQYLLVFLFFRTFSLSSLRLLFSKNNLLRVK